MSFSPYDHIDDHLNAGMGSTYTMDLADDLQAHVANGHQSWKEILGTIFCDEIPKNYSPADLIQVAQLHVQAKIIEQLQILNARMGSIETIVLALEKHVWEFEHIPDERPLPKSEFDAELQDHLEHIRENFID
jgi:hypothetical protein